MGLELHWVCGGGVAATETVPTGTLVKLSAANSVNSVGTNPFAYGLSSRSRAAELASGAGEQGLETSSPSTPTTEEACSSLLLLAMLRSETAPADSPDALLPEE